MSASPSLPAKRISTFIVVAVLALAALCFGVSWLSYPSAQAHLRALSLIRSSEVFTLAFYGGLQKSLREIGFLLLLASLALLALRRPIARIVDTLWRDATRDWNGNIARAGARFRAGLREIEPFEALALLLITLVGLVNRLFFLSRAIRYDEAYSLLNYGSKPLLVTLAHYSENNHIFHNLLVHWSVSMFGFHLWSVRLPVLLFGTLLIPIAYFTAKQLYGKNAAMLSAALVATSSILIDYSTNARGYIIVCCCFLLLLSVGQMILDKSEPLLFLFFAAIAIIGFYAVPVMLIPFGVVVCWMHCSMARRGMAQLLQFEKCLVAALALIGLVCAALYTPPVLFSGWSAVTRPARWAIPNPDLLLLSISVEMYYALSAWVRDVPLFLTLLLLGGYLVSLAFRGGKGDRHRALLASLLVWTSAVLVLTHLPPLGRCWLFVVPAYFMGASWGLTSVLEKLLRGRVPTRLTVAAGTAAVLCLLTLKNVNSESILRTQETEGLRDAAKITGVLIQRKAPLNRIVVQCAPIIEYYLSARDHRRVKLGFEPPLPGTTETVWIVVNHGWYGTLGEALGRHRLRAVNIVSVDRFYAAGLYQVVVRPAPASVQE